LDFTIEKKEKGEASEGTWGPLYKKMFTGPKIKCMFERGEKGRRADEKGVRT